MSESQSKDLSNPGENGDCETGNCEPNQATPIAKEKVSDSLTNWQAFIPPLKSINGLGDALLPSIVIEFCNRCRWQHRATWIQTELFITFENKQEQQLSQSTDQVESKSGGKYSTPVGLKSIQLIPCNKPETGGRFRVWLYRNSPITIDRPSQSEKGAIGTYDDGKIVLLWDRKIRDSFPELKELKQIVRDHIAPDHNLGHSDRKKEA